MSFLDLLKKVHSLNSDFFPIWKSSDFFHFVKIESLFPFGRIEVFFSFGKIVSLIFSFGNLWVFFLYAFFPNRESYFFSPPEIPQKTPKSTQLHRSDGWEISWLLFLQPKIFTKWSKWEESVIKMDVLGQPHAARGLRVCGGKISGLA